VSVSRRVSCPVARWCDDGGSSPSLLPLARLWAKTSGKGTAYMVGRLDLAKLVLLPVRDDQADGHTHKLFITAPNEPLQPTGTAPRAPAQARQSAPPPPVRRRRYPQQRSSHPFTRSLVTPEALLCVPSLSTIAPGCVSVTHG
jgi:hypothetical protein